MTDVHTQYIKTHQSHKIARTIFSANGDNSKAVVIIGAAMGVKQKSYKDFAKWLAEQGFTVVTYDYYGIGLSQEKPLREIQTTVTEWATVDSKAIIDEVRNIAAEQKIIWLGHSVGSQIVGMIPNREHISKIITISSGSGYWRENTPQLKRFVWLMWYFIAPISMALCGYFPGKTLKAVGDLPKGVMQQWRKWCLNKDYLIGIEGEHIKKQYAEITIPITSLSFTDDEFMSAKNINSLHDFYASAPQKRLRFEPQDFNAKYIGHFGFFNAKLKDTLWTQQLLPELLEITKP